VALHCSVHGAWQIPRIFHARREALGKRLASLVDARFRPTRNFSPDCAQFPLP
jgi:hypothetical protein